MIRIDGYELGEPLGAGGFGEVFRAKRTDLGRDVAIKILHAEHCRDATAVARFEAEARAASKIDHPGIVRVYDVGKVEGRLYCVMELLAGRSLRAILDERGALPLNEAAPLLASFAAAIDAAHAAGVAHRDLKPENLFVEPDSSVRVIDFGLAKLAAADHVTTTGRVMGSPRYMSPEQCRGRASDKRSDYYSFGAVVYHVLTGAPPFDGDALALALHHLNDSPEPPSARCPGLPPRVDEVVVAMLAKDPDRRPGPLAATIASLTGGEVVVPKRRRGLVLAIAAALAVVGLAVGVALRGSAHRDAPRLGPTPPVEPLRLVASFPVEHNIGPSLDRDGKLINIHDAQHFELIDPTHPTRAPELVPFSYIDTLSDGRRLVVTPRGIDVVGADGTQMPLVSAESLRATTLSPDRMHIAVVSRAGLELYDITTKQRRTLVANIREAVDVRWSPNGSQLIWATGRDGRVGIVRVSDGTGHELTLPMASDFARSNADFLDEDHILYCALENEHVTLRVRSTAAAGDSGRVIRELDRKTSDCGISRTGNHVAVAVMSGRRESAKLDRVKRTPVALDLPLGTTIGAITPDARSVVASSGSGFVTIDLATKQRTPIRACTAGLRKAFRGRAGIEWFGFDPKGNVTQLALASETCVPLGRWELADRLSTYNGLSCSHDLCVITTLRGREIGVWSLPLGAPAKQIARIALDRDLASSLMADVSPDARHVAIVAQGDVVGPWIVDVASGKARTITDGKTFAASILWSDNEHVLLSSAAFAGDNMPPKLGALVAGLDGSIDWLWQDPDIYFFGLARSDDGELIIGDMKVMHTDVLVFETT